MGADPYLDEVDLDARADDAAIERWQMDQADKAAELDDREDRMVAAWRRD